MKLITEWRLFAAVKSTEAELNKVVAPEAGSAR